MSKPRSQTTAPVVFTRRLYRGKTRLRIALVGMPGSGKSTVFKAVSSTSIESGTLTANGQPYSQCCVQIGMHEADLVDLPSMDRLHNLPPDQLAALKYLLWGTEKPVVSVHEPSDSSPPISAPDVIIQVIDATDLQSHLNLTLELLQLGRPLVIALNMMDQAWEKGMHLNVKLLQHLLGVPVVPLVAIKGQGIAELFDVVVRTVQKNLCPVPRQMSQYIIDSLQPLSDAIAQVEVHAAFRVPHHFLLTRFALNDPYFVDEFRQHFTDRLPQLLEFRAQASGSLPRPLNEEILADQHHNAAQIKESVTRMGAPHAGHGWQFWLDDLFLHPRWGLIGSLVVFALILFVVFEVSGWLDSISTARLAELITDWHPTSALGVTGRGIVDGLLGLVGIVIPYMIPLVLLLVALEESGIMHRIAFVVDRWFHHLGLHGGVAVPFLLGLGCNVPALSAMARVTQGRERLIASVLVTFVPCSARSAVILAIAGKYLGGLGVFTIFFVSLIIIALLGQLLRRYYQESGPGQIQEIPSYAWPRWRSMLRTTWERTSDILTIVTPLLVGGSVVLALLGYIGADKIINTVFSPITHWWLGLPVILGVPILFGVLRKELSLLMIYQALGTFNVNMYLDWVQMMTFLVFLTFYFPCVSTFAVMLKTIGRRQALASVSLSIVVALLVSGIFRGALEVVRYLS